MTSPNIFTSASQASVSQVFASQTSTSREIASQTSTSESNGSFHEYSCIFCPQIYPTASALRDHYLNSQIHSPTLVRRNRSQLLNTPHTALIVCPTCSDLNISLGQQGYSLHRHHRHIPDSKSTPTKNSSIISDLFHPSNGLLPWLDTLAWLHSHENLSVPPPYRRSLYSKLPHRIRERFQDHVLLILRAIQLASQQLQETQNLTPAYEYSPKPLIFLFALFETVILAPPNNSDPHTYRRLIPYRLEHFRDGHFRSLYEQVYNMPPRPQATYDSAFDSLHISRSIEAAVRNGNLRSALERLDPQPRAFFTPKNIEIIRNLHPPPIHTCSFTPSPPTDDLSSFHLDQLHFTMRQSPRGKAPGYLADSPDLLLDIERRAVPGCIGLTGDDLLSDLYRNLLTGHYPEDVWLLLNPNYLQASHKDFQNHPEKLRPINMGTALRRNLCRHLVKALAPELAEFFISHQFAIGVSGGLDFIIHTVMQILQTRMDPRLNINARFALLALDFKNMFNEISRVKTREELATHFPQLLYLFDRLYPLTGNVNYYQKPDGSWGSFIQKEGYAQGCPLAPLLACLVLLRLLTDLQTELDQRAINIPSPPSDLYPTLPSYTLAYMDDTEALIRLLDIAFVFQYIAEHGPDYGLHLSREKNHILLSTTGSFPNDLPNNLRQEIQWAADTFCKGNIELDGITLLGHPIGNTSYVSTKLQNYAQIFANTTKLLCERVPLPATRLRLFTSCIQEQIPFRQFADGALPTTTLTIKEGGNSPFIKSILNTTQNFLCSLADTTQLPMHSWTLATLPIRLGGLNFHDPTAQALPSFLRPILRTLRYASIGIPVKDFAILARNPTTRESEAVSWINLPPYLRTIFTNWQSSAVTFLQRFTNLIVPYLQQAYPHYYFDLLLDPHENPLNAIKNANAKWLQKRYESRRSTFPLSFLQVEPSLRSPLISKALTQLPLNFAAYRTPAYLYVLALKRKLRLPLITHPTTCAACHKSCDIYGDHTFQCSKNHKTQLHDRVRDSLYVVLSHLSTYAHLSATDASVVLEPSGLLPQYPTLRPADIAVRPNPGILKSHTTCLLFDVTAIQMPSSSSRSVSSDPKLSIVVRAHEKAENDKFVGRSHNNQLPGQITQAILDKHYTLIPVTFDPGGLLGPLSTSFLWGTIPPDLALLPYPKTFEHRLQTHLSTSPYPRQAATQTYDTIASFGLFRLADKGWQQAHLQEWFTTSYTATLPSQWAQQILGQNLLVANSRHLQQGLQQSFPIKTHHANSTLNVAGLHPRHNRPTAPLPAEFFYRQTAVRPTDE